MAIDPSIPLGVRPLQLPNVMEQQAQALNIRNMMGQGLMQGLELQQRQMELGDQQVMRQKFPELLQKNNGDIDKAIQELTPFVSPKTSLSLQQSLLGNGEKRAQIAKAQADAAEATGKVQQAQTEYLGHVALGVQKGGYDPTAFDAALLDAEHVNPSLKERLEGYRQAAAQNPGVIRQVVDGMVNSSGVAQKEREVAAAETTAQARKSTADTSATRLQLETPAIQAQNLTRNLQTGAQTLSAVTDQASYDAWREQNPDSAKRLPPMFSPAAKELGVRMGLTADQQITTAQTAANAAETSRHNKIEENQGAARVGVERGRLSVEQRNAGLDANGQPVQYTDPQTGQAVNIDPMARAIAAYKLPPAAARGYAQARGLMNQVLTVNPNFDIGQYQQRFDTMKNLAPSGKLGQQALALNTLIRHSDDLYDAVEALGNGSFTPANAGYQKLRQLMGDSAPTNFDQLKQYVAGETTKLVRGGAGTEEDVRNAAANINRAGSPKQLLDALKTNFAVAGGKLEALNQSVRTSVGDDKYTALDDGAAQILQKRGFDLNTMKKPVGAAGINAHVIELNGKHYRYKGTGNTADLSNYTEVKQ